MIRRGTNRADRLRGYKAGDTSEGVVDRVILRDEFRNRVEGMPGAQENYAVWEGERLDIILPEIGCEFLAFAASYVGCCGCVLEGG